MSVSAPISMSSRCWTWFAANKKLLWNDVILERFLLAKRIVTRNLSFFLLRFQPPLKKFPEALQETTTNFLSEALRFISSYFFILLMLNLKGSLDLCFVENKSDFVKVYFIRNPRVKLNLPSYWFLSTVAFF